MGYFTVEVKPTIPTVTAGQSTAFAQNDVLFDWYAFDVPKGTCRLLHIDQEIRPKGDSGATVNEFDLDLLLAKANQNGTAPTSIGTLNAAPTANVNLSNNMMGFIANGSWEAHEAHLDSTAYTQCREVNCGMFFSNPGPQVTTKGYDRYYIAAIAEGAFDFRSACTINAGDLTGPVLTVADLDARLFLAVGDTIGVTTAADAAISKDMGIIKSIDSATQITLESAFTTAVVDNDIVHNQAPITFRLHFEY